MQYNLSTLVQVPVQNSGDFHLEGPGVSLFYAVFRMVCGKITLPRHPQLRCEPRPAAWDFRQPRPEGGADPVYFNCSGGVNPPFGKVLLGKTIGTRLRRGGKAAGEPAQEPAAYRSSRK